MSDPLFPFGGGLNGDPEVPDRDYEDLFYEDVVDLDWDEAFEEEEQ